MKASEARKLTQQSLPDPAEMEPIYNAIKLRAGMREHYLHYNQRLTSRACEQLERDGYEVENLSDRDGVLFRISWAKK